MFKKIIPILVLSLFVMVGCNDAPVIDEKDLVEKNEVVEVVEVVEVKTYSSADILTHNTAEDCWLLIDGKVYDVTDFVGKHPGGEALLEGCGIDATELYETRPMGSGTPHSDKARDLRENYYIGNLK